METNYDDRNKSQIIRIDARNCFVESKSDSFEIGKAHLEFATYDMSKPAGQRQTNNVHIYIDLPEFLCLTYEALTGILHNRARQMKANKDTTALYQCLGGTSADKLKQYNRARPDGKSLSRIAKLIYSDMKDDHYLFVADSGPGDTDAKGLIVPRFGKKPENHVAVSMSWRNVNELLLMTKTHYEAWLSAKYTLEIAVATNSQQEKTHQQASVSKTPVQQNAVPSRSTAKRPEQPETIHSAQQYVASGNVATGKPGYTQADEIAFF